MYYKVSLYLGAGIDMATVVVKARYEEEAFILASLKAGVVVDADEADDNVKASGLYTYLDRTEYGSNCVYLLTVNAKIEPVEGKVFVVCLDESYVRDAQMLDTDGLSDEEFENLNYTSSATEEADELWHDMEPRPFIDIVYAFDEAEACEIAGEKNRYDPRCLYAFEAKPTNI